MSVTLESLQLGEERLAVAREEVRKLAYEKWREAGQPPEGDINFWVIAERDWIERVYVPDRTS